MNFEKRFALVFAVASLLSFTELSAQERGFYVVADGSYGFYGQFGYNSNERDFVQVRTSGVFKEFDINFEDAFSMGEYNSSKTHVIIIKHFPFHL